MSTLQGIERSRYVQAMFARIAGRYDLMNRLMTAGQDRYWRREVIRRAMLSPQARLLDLGTGTGDLCREALRQMPTCRVVAADFTLEMMRIGQSRCRSSSCGALSLAWAGADAQLLPFPNDTFDAVVSGFLLRNVSHIAHCLSEQYRVLKPGGRIVVLDTCPPPINSPLLPFMHFHLHTIIPLLGQWIGGQADAYHYLPSSTEGFLEPERLTLRLVEAGFQRVGFQRRMFGVIAIHWGYK